MWIEKSNYYRRVSLHEAPTNKRRYNQWNQMEMLTVYVGDICQGPRLERDGISKKVFVRFGFN